MTSEETQYVDCIIDIGRRPKNVDVIDIGGDWIVPTGGSSWPSPYY